MSPDLHRAVLGCLLPSFDGPTPPEWVLRALADGLGGVVLFAPNTAAPDRDPGADPVDTVRALTGRLRDAAARDVVVAADEEGGEVTRLDAVAGSPVPTAAALGHLDDVATTRAVAAWTGDRLAAAGITLDLAPVADVNEPGNPVIGVRAFGSDPRLVARHVAATVAGLQDAGIAACAKHFPGHGDTRTDSHVGVATVDRSADLLREVDLAPFRAAVDAGCRAVMTGHLLVPALDPYRLVTVSPDVTTGLLRGELGFTGAVVTDALEMGALAGSVGMVQGAVGALVAGADTLETGAVEDPGMVDRIVEAVLAAVGDGRLPESRVHEAAARTAALGRRPDAAPAGDPTRPGDPAHPVDPVPGTVAAAAALALEVFGTLPRLVAPFVLECRSPGSVATGPRSWSFGDRLARRLPGTSVAAADGTAEPPLPPPGHPVVLVVRDLARHPWQRQLLERLAGRTGAVVVDVGWPGETAGLPTVRTRGTGPAQLAAAVERLVDAR